jgi:hypothetical protein
LKLVGTIILAVAIIAVALYTGAWVVFLKTAVLKAVMAGALKLGLAYGIMNGIISKSNGGSFIEAFVAK